MNSTQYMKVFGLIGSIAAALATAIGGDFVTAGGLIASALASASAFKKSH